MTERERNLKMRPRGFALGSIALLVAASACSGGGGPSDEGAMLPNAAGQGSSSGNGPSAGAGNGVLGFNRPPGMPIGRGVSSGEGNETNEPGAEGSSAVAGSGGEVIPGGSDEVEIPVFDVPSEDPPPCSGCVELNADVNDINQRDSFVFSAGGVSVTRVVWTIIIPFNSDQLFVQPFVDSNYGTYTDLDANAFPIDTPVQLVHAYTGNASTVGLAIGSAGAWTGNMTMSVFVDAVTLEGADPAASLSFDGGVEGLGVGSNSRNPGVVFHP
jgi:hypothetical protein